MDKEIEDLIASGVLEVALFKAYGGKEYEAERLMLYRARMAPEEDGPKRLTMAMKKQATDMAITDAEHVQRRARQIIADATGFSRASASPLEELTDAGCIADGFNTVKQAKAAGQKSGMLRNGDTFGREF